MYKLVLMIEGQKLWVIAIINCQIKQKFNKYKKMVWVIVMRGIKNNLLPIHRPTEYILGL